MTDRATPNLPARDFDETAQFYEALGFRLTGEKDEDELVMSLPL